MSEKIGKTFDLFLLNRVLTYVKPYFKIFYGTAFCAILIAFLSPTRPLLIQYAFDNYIITPNENKLLLITCLLVVLLFAESILQYLYTYWSNYLGQSVIRDIRLSVYKKIINFKQQYFDKNPIGALVTRVVSDIETISDIFSQGLLVIIADILKLIVVLIVMFLTDWRLTLFSLASIPLLLIATYWFKRSIKSAFQDVRKQVSLLNSFVQEHIVGMYIVQLFNREDIEFEKFKNINNAHKNAHIKSIFYYSVFFPVVEILSAISIGLLIWWGGVEVVTTNNITLGELIAFILYIHMLFRPIRQLADRFNVLQMGMVASERVFKVLDTDNSIKNNGKKTITKCKGDVEFKNVWFAYNDDDWVLRNVSFKVSAGEKVAIVGSTGAGKSTIINLLTRNYEINEGMILIDGINYLEYDLYSLRKNIAVVLQDVFLFSDTIFNNIVLGRNIKLEKVKAYAKEIDLDEYIQSLPNGYFFNVRERGGMLSSGQRQLISFVRAYIDEPSILVLDEATSNIDSESESLIQNSCEKITKNRTSIIIAHRIATVKNADKILLFDNGILAEEGSHQELLLKDGKYKLLYELQFQD
ncbi:MAG: antibiotic ABC transporter ATP-binding protein [Flavobacteriales bacterium]|nr:antibiotic ABC transporter ATP-binding protein [Flavobacteriales bacterium]